MKCKGCPYPGPTIAPSGNTEAEVVIVGEAPGAEEIYKGEPFVGPSGQLLWSTLGKNGVSRSQCYVTNALLCRPPVGQPPDPKAIASCRGRLLEEVQAHPRKVIIALGNTAVRALTGNNKLKITQIRGKAIEQPDLSPIVPTLHPAAVLRQNGYYKSMAGDMAYACQIAKNGQVRSPGETRYVVLRDPEKIKEAIAELLTYDYLAADIETAGYNYRYHRLLCIGIAWAPNKVVVFPGDTLKEHIDLFKPLFSDPEPRWIWHNGKFDTGFLQQLGLPARVDEDVMLASYALNEMGGVHDLEQLATTLLGAKDYKATPKQYMKKGDEGFERVPKKVLYRYNAMDCDYTYQLFHQLRQRIAAQPNIERLYTQLLIPASALLQRVEQRGLYVDSDHLEELKADLGRQLADALQAVHTESLEHWDAEAYTDAVGAIKVPRELNPGSPKQMQWLLYDRLGLKPPKGFKANTNKETLSRLPKHPLVEALLDVRRIGKMYDTYVLGFEKRRDPFTGRVHTTFKIHGTRNGRLSSANPNVQNIDRRPIMRDIISAPPISGKILVEIDQSQAELRVLAALSGDEWLTQVYREGRNLHDEVAKHFYGPDYTVNQKIRAKAVNFGIAYGRREHSLVLEHGLSMVEASKLVREWFERMPDAYEFLKACQHAVVAGKALENPYGRRRRFGLVTPENLKELQNESTNFPPASTASDMNLDVAIRIDPIALERGIQMVNLVHDSILFEMPNDPELIEWLYHLVRTTFEQVALEKLGPEVPWAVEIKAGHSWGSLRELHFEGVKV